MIIQDVTKILESSTGIDEGLENLADMFRSGRNIQDILPLLHSNDYELIRIGAWIYGEVGGNSANSGVSKIRCRLFDLLSHEVAVVRWQALVSIYPDMDPMDSATTARVQLLTKDQNEGIRSTAERILLRFGSGEK